ncbi:hypothetical protein [Mycobacteroides abscessus]|uniref:hypothetical protein n=1 Tax=Mycobacteroides abscessus TaxID=36809 RepID=UPI002103DC12|nr:hypothetical protein [Mycobacteroides abscessus]
MSEPIQVSFSGELPSQLADLRSLREDFQFAQNCALAYLNLHLANMNDESRKVVSRALWVSAAIAYRRGFTTGKAQLVPQGNRLKIPQDWFDSLKPEGKVAHDGILEIANKQIAHHTGKHENYSVVAFLAPPPQPRALAGVGVIRIGLASPGDERIQQLGALCQSLINGIDRRIEELTNEFESFVKAQNLDDLYDDPTKINTKDDV